MGLFEKAGKTFEETKQALIGGEAAEYICRSCEEPVEEAHEHCPHCGEKTVEDREQTQ